MVHNLRFDDNNLREYWRLYIRQQNRSFSIRTFILLNRIYSRGDKHSFNGMGVTMKHKTSILIASILFGAAVLGFIKAKVIKTGPQVPLNDTSATTGQPETKLGASESNLEPTIEDLLDAIEMVESGGDCNAVGDNGEAVGPYQIHKIYVDDVRRITGIGFTYDDRWDREKSRNMTRLYTFYWWGYYIDDIGYENRFEAMARIHNGGPRGWEKESTKPYWQKIKAVLYARGKTMWLNQRTGETDCLTEMPEDFRDYIPQHRAAQGLYEIYLEQGLAPVEAAKKVLTACIEAAE